QFKSLRKQLAVRRKNQLDRLGYGFISDRRKAQRFSIQVDGNCFFRMHLQPGRLPIRNILAIGWKLLQFSRGGEQCGRSDLTNDKYIEKTVVNACPGSELDTAASLPRVPDDGRRDGASNFAVRQPEHSMILVKIDRQNCTHHSVGGRTKQAFEIG